MSCRDESRGTCPSLNIFAWTIKNLKEIRGIQQGHYPGHFFLAEKKETKHTFKIC